MLLAGLGSGLADHDDHIAASCQNDRSYIYTLRHVSNRTQTKTIHEFLADDPDVDRSELWAAFWGILSEAKDKITAELDVKPHPSGAGPRVLDHRGRRLRGLAQPLRRRPGQRRRVAGPLLDRQPQDLDPGHEPPGLARSAHRRAAPGARLRHSAQRLPLQRPGARAATRWSTSTTSTGTSSPRTRSGSHLRGDDRFPGRSATAPTCGRSTRRSPTPTWRPRRRRGRRGASARLCATASTPGSAGSATRTPVPVEERAALRERDHQVREYGYTLDPMNELSKKFLGAERVDELVADPRRPGPDRGFRRADEDPGRSARAWSAPAAAARLRALGHEVTVTTTTPGKVAGLREPLRGGPGAARQRPRRRRTPRSPGRTRWSSPPGRPPRRR